LLSRKKRQKPRKLPPLKPYNETDEAGVLRFVRLAFRKAVERTGRVVVVRY
jgi:hypothetical protein